LENTSLPEIAAEVLECCRLGRAVPERLQDRLLSEATQPDAERAAAAATLLFNRIAEPLADSFEPSHCDSYARLFAGLLGSILPDLDADGIIARYFRVREHRRCLVDPGSVRKVFVLSRVTLGADVSITSIVLDAAKKRFPKADIYFVGARKGWELFANDSRIQFCAAEYPRGGTLANRLHMGLKLRDAWKEPGSIVIDPDSRITQLGLLPVCAEEDYFFFESRRFGGDGDSSLTQLTKRWVAETFGVADALPYIDPAPAKQQDRPASITVSLGVGGNQAKRIADPFESELLKCLLQFDLPILVDTGAGGEEARRVESAIAAAGDRRGLITTWSGAFAPFASRIAASELYVGYDSAGQHVAAASKVSLLSIFAGYHSQRFLDRWKPGESGRSIVLPAGGVAEIDVLRLARRSILNLLKINMMNDPGETVPEKN